MGILKFFVFSYYHTLTNGKYLHLSEEDKLSCILDDGDH